jgi:hypothetical protein
VHGEPEKQQALAAGLKARFGVDARIPARGESLAL